MSKSRVLSLLSWSVSVTLIALMLIVVGLVSMIVGDWIILKTANEVLAWGVGLFIFFGFLCSMGAGIGIWLWLKGPTSYAIEDKTRADISSSQRD